MFTSPYSVVFLLLVISLPAINSRDAYTATLSPSPEEFDAYVDNNAVGDEKGTKDLPYHTITKALDNATGRSIKVRGGKDYNETIKITNKIPRAAVRLIGEPFAAIKPRIVAGDGPIVSIERSDVAVEGFEITNGSFLKPSNQSTLTDTTGIKVEPGTERVTIAHNRFHTIGREYDKTCKCHPEKECPCAGQAHAINVRSYAAEAIKDVTIADNELFNLHLGRSEAIAVNGNVSKFLVARNYVHDVDNIAIDIGGNQETECGATIEPKCQANNGVVTGNTTTFVYASLEPADPHFNPGQVAFKDDKKIEVTVIRMGAIYVDGGTNVTLERNRVHDSAMGIDVGSEKGATVRDVWVINNLLYSNKSAGIKIGNTEEASRVVKSHFVNNTLVNNNSEGNDNGSLYFGTADQPARHFCDITIANNLITTNDKRSVVTNVYAGPKKCDWQKPNIKDEDCNKSVPCTVKFVLNGFYSLDQNTFQNEVPSYASFKTKFNPQAVEFKPFNLDGSFYLLRVSPARDAGDKSTLPCSELEPRCMDHAGRTRLVGKLDLGAFEFQ